MSAPILIVEDDPLQREMLATLLRRKLDYDTCTARNGREALDILYQDQSHTIKLVVLDLEMPVMGGMETLDVLRQRYPLIPVIMLTGSKDTGHVVNAMKLGATDFVTKPYEADRMATTVKNTLKMGLLSREVARLKGQKKRCIFIRTLNWP